MHLFRPERRVLPLSNYLGTCHQPSIRLPVNLETFQAVKTHSKCLLFLLKTIAQHPLTLAVSLSFFLSLFGHSNGTSKTFPSASAMQYDKVEEKPTPNWENVRCFLLVRCWRWRRRRCFASPLQQQRRILVCSELKQRRARHCQLWLWLLLLLLLQL